MSSLFARFPRVLRKIPQRDLNLTSNNYREFENPIYRTLRILKEDFTNLRGFVKNREEKDRALMGLFPVQTDILIIGGGSIGSSIAYWLKEKTSREGIRVVVLDKDMTFSKCSTVLSAGGLHQHYSLPENIQMSLFGAQFLRTIRKTFGPGTDIQYTPCGHLILADEKNAAKVIDNTLMEREFGVTNQILTKAQLQEKFPWMNPKDVEVGCYGPELHGWFDPWAVFSALRFGAMDLGAQYIEGELVDFIFCERGDYVQEGMEDYSYEAINEAVIKMPNGEHKTMEFAYVIIAAGNESPEVAKLAKIGESSGMLSFPLPIKKKNRYLYKFNCVNNPPGINSPMVIDTTGAYFRRHGLGGTFLAGASPVKEPEISNEEFFHQEVYPTLENRVPSFKSIKLLDSWCGSYEHNYFDDTGIVGPHPYYHNLYIATGFSSYGIQQAPAIGRAVAEMLIDGNFKTIDLTRFGFDRLIVDKPMYEYGVI